MSMTQRSCFRSRSMRAVVLITYRLMIDVEEPTRPSSIVDCILPVPCRRSKAACGQSRISLNDRRVCERLEPGDAGEIEVGNFHGGQLHLPVFVGHGIHGSGKGLDLAEGTKGAFVPTKIDERRGDAAVLDEIDAVARHAR